MDDEIPYLSYEIAGNRWHFLHGASIQYVIYLPFSARMGFHGTPEGLSRSNRFEIRLRASLPSFRTPSGLSNAPPLLRERSFESLPRKEFLNSFSRTVCARRSRGYLYPPYFPSYFASYFRPTVIPPFASFPSNCCPCAKGEGSRTDIGPSGGWLLFVFVSSFWLGFSGDGDTYFVWRKKKRKKNN